MNRTTKILGAGAAITALSLAGAYAFADQGHGPWHGRMGMGHGMGQGMMDGGGRGGQMGQFGDPAERLASAKTAIGIKAEQTAAWEAYAKVVTETAAGRREYLEKMDHDTIRNMKPDERETFRNSMLKQRDEARVKIKAAADSLLAQLDETQKAKAQQTLPGLVAGGPGHGSGPGMRHGMMMGRDMGDGAGMDHDRREGMGHRWQR